MTSTTDKKAPEAGSFGYQTVVGLYEPTLEATFPTATHFGLVQESSYFYGAFVDEDGVRYNLLRRMYWDYTPHFMPVLQSTEGSDNLMPDLTFLEMYQGIIVQKIEGDKHIMEGVNPMAKHGFHVERGADSILLHEGDVVQVEGKLIGKGMQWYTPDVKSPACYLSHIHKVEGTIKGKKVKGILAWDVMYLKPGMNWNTADYYRHGLGDWFTPAKLYKDGSVEVGQICWARNDEGNKWGFAMLQDQDGPLVMTNNIQGEATKTDEGFPARVDVKIDGVDYEWEALPKGEMRFGIMMDAPYRGADGAFRRVGDDREVELSLGWIDFFENYDGDSVIV